MTNLVQFPGLGLSFEINRVALSIGGFNIYWYGVCIAFFVCVLGGFCVCAPTHVWRGSLASFLYLRWRGEGRASN